MKFTGILLNLDGVPDSQYDMIECDAGIEIAKDIVVTHEFDQSKVLGIGTVTREGNALKYEIDIEFETLPNNLLGEFYPCAGGSIKGREGKKITGLHVTSIGLSIYGNADKRIKRLNGKD